MTASALHFEPHRPRVLPHAEIRYWAHFCPPDTSRKLFQTLHKQLAWQQQTLRLFGAQHAVPRLSALYGDAGLAYTYSGIEHQAQLWTPTLAALRTDIEAAAGASFNSVLANLYRDGQDSNGWHADNEPELGANPVIASLSLGAPRDFQFKHRRLREHSYSCELGDGSLLIMAGAMQAHWLHQLPKRRRVNAPRINLTFRLICAAPLSETQ